MSTKNFDFEDRCDDDEILETLEDFKEALKDENLREVAEIVISIFEKFGIH